MDTDIEQIRDVWRPMRDHRPRSKRILVDGQEGVEGRALMTLSALHHSAGALRGHFIEVIHCDDPAVSVAAAALAADEGLSIACYPSSESPARWAGAHLYVSIRFRNLDGAANAEAYHNRIPALVALQFPHADLFDSPVMRRVRAAHDPALMAQMIAVYLGQGGSDAP